MKNIYSSMSGMAVFVMICFSVPAMAGNVDGDTSIFGGGVINVKPNILIIFDNSGSMNSAPSSSSSGGSSHFSHGNQYDASTTYTSTNNYDADYVYRGIENNNSYTWEKWQKLSDIQCTDLVDELNSKGTANAKNYNLNADLSCCDGGKGWGNSCTYREGVYRTGNYMNFLYQDDSSSSSTTTSTCQDPDNCLKIEIARDTIKGMLTDTSFNPDNVRLGLMVFNSNAEGGYILAPLGSDAETISDAVDSVAENVMNNKGTNTPLTESLAEAGLYFARGRSWFNPTSSSAKLVYDTTSYPAGGGSATAAILARCQQNHIIIITDGEPTKDDNSLLSVGNSYIYSDITLTSSSGSKAKLNDIASILHNKDLIRDPVTDVNGISFDALDYPTQTITIWTIGFDTSSTLLETTANSGGGKYYTTSSGLTLDEILSDIYANIASDNAQYVSPVVPVNRSNRTFSDNAMYLGLFAPKADGLWNGNIKKFGLKIKTVIEDGEEVSVLQITDRNGDDATDANGQFYASAHSAWYNVPDAEEGLTADIGGAGAVINTATRNTFTIKEGTKYSLLTSISTTDLTPADFGVGSEDERNDLIAYMNGTGIYAPSGTNVLKREWLIGDILHSQPAIIYDYDNDQNVLIVGANDGFLHCFIDNDQGTSDDLTDDVVSESWAYAPYDILKNLPYLPPAGEATYITSDNDHDYYVDGTPVVYTTTSGDRYVITGLRRGALYVANAGATESYDSTTKTFTNQQEVDNVYFTLNITDYTAPTHAWNIPRTIISNTALLGQSWSTPKYCRLKGTTVTDVLILTGGYDTHQDSVYPGSTDTTATDSKGCSLLVVDATDGSKFRSWTGTNCMVDFTSYDDNDDGYEDVIYIPDLAGNLFVFHDKDGDGTWKVRKLFSAPYSAPSSESKATQHNYARKFFYAPGIAQISALVEYVYIGSGDREHPTDATTDMVNRFYAIKNTWSETNTITGDTDPLTGLVDVSPDVTQGTVSSSSSLTDAQKVTWRQTLGAERGWFIDMLDDGEKIVGTPTVYNEVVYFTTFVPGIDASTTDTCGATGNGTAYMWAVNYKTGEAVFEFNGVDGLTKEDRRLGIGTGIPSETMIIVTKSGTYVGAATQNKVPLQSTSDSRGVYKYYWQRAK